MQPASQNPAIRYPTFFYGRYFVSDGGKPIDTYVRHPIEWFVLCIDSENNRALLLSKYALDWEGFADCPIFGHGYETSWQTSYLRSWLNDGFYKESFSAEEQRLILPSPETSDKIFLLSADEVRKYFPEKETAVALEPMIFAASRTARPGCFFTRR